MSREDVHSAVSARPDGVSMAELEAELPSHRRTVLRHLRALIDDGVVRREGGGRSTRYFPVRQIHDTSAGRPRYSTTSKQALDRVNRPLTGREPVGYEPAFLLDYEPNVTEYLNATVRADLRSRGRLSDHPLPAGTYARRILDRLLIDLSWNSSRLEGNTYSLLETELLLSAGVEAPERDPLETQMILNHKAAIEFLVDGAGDVGFDRHSILNLHALLSDNLLHNPADGGRLRQAAVGIGGSVFEPLQNPPAHRGVLRHRPGRGERHRGPVRRGVLRVGAPAVPAAVHRRE